MTPAVVEVLVALRRSPGRRYGYDLIRELGMPSGVLYPVLRRAEAAGWVVSEREEVNPSAVQRPARVWYQLTGAGRRVVEDAARRAAALAGGGGAV